MSISCANMNGSRIKVFIDYNSDGDFCDAGEEVYNYWETNVGNFTYTPGITIPSSATPGVTGMRCFVDYLGDNFGACGANNCNGTVTWAGYGEVEDYNINLVGTTPPNCATLSYPSNGASNIAVDTALKWNDGGGGTNGYSIYFGTNNPPTNILNGTNIGNITSYTFSPILQSNTQYFWKIVAYNINGNAVGCSIWSFTTGPYTGITGYSPADDIISVYPNPVRDYFNVNFSSLSGEIVNIELIDLTGGLVWSENFQAGAGENKFEVNADILNDGIYYCRITTGKDVRIIKIVKIT